MNNGKVGTASFCSERTLTPLYPPRDRAALVDVNAAPRDPDRTAPQSFDPFRKRTRAVILSNDNSLLINLIFK